MKYHDSDFIEIENYDVKMGLLISGIIALLSFIVFIVGAKSNFDISLFIGLLLLLFVAPFSYLTIWDSTNSIKELKVPKSKKIRMIQKEDNEISLYYKRLGSYWLWKSANVLPEELLAKYTALFDRSKKKEGIGEIIYDKRVIV